MSWRTNSGKTENQEAWVLTCALLLTSHTTNTVGEPHRGLTASVKILQVKTHLNDINLFVWLNAFFLFHRIPPFCF